MPLAHKLRILLQPDYPMRVVPDNVRLDERVADQLSDIGRCAQRLQDRLSNAA